jgi:predicted PurR-regulated permease PerM
MQADDPPPPSEPDAEDRPAGGAAEPDAAAPRAPELPTPASAAEQAAPPRAGGPEPPATGDDPTAPGAPAARDVRFPSQPRAHAVAPPPGDDPVPRWLRSGAAIAWRLIAIAAAVALTVYALAYLHIVVLPIIVALLLSTVLRPPTRWLARHHFSDAAAAATVMIAAIAVLASAIALAGAAIGRQFEDLADSVQDGVREAGDALAQPPFNLSKADIQQKIDDGVENLSSSSSSLTDGVLHGAIVVGEVITGLIITLLLLFFFLKDGPEMWRWVVETTGGRQRRRMDEMAQRCYTALAGYVRGLVLVGIADATMIGTGLLILGVPLVAPLMLLTFLGAFIPLIGAFSAGLAAVLIALVSGGVVTALIVLGLVIAVQQVEGHLLYPIIMGRTIKIHPIAVILSLATGGILAGVIGVFISVPIVTVAATALAYLRETRERPALEPA